MEFIKYPNCPERQVCLVAIGKCFDKAKIALSKLGVESLVLAPNPLLGAPVVHHSDMLFTHLGDNRILINQHSDNTHLFLQNGFEIQAFLEAKSPYPLEAMYNMLFLGKHIFYHPKSTPIEHIKDIDRYKLVPVKQGYTKCSCAVVGKNAIITSDQSIARCADRVGVDVLQICPGYISLAGYECGFIGGCCGLISNTILAFCGDISFHPDCNRILDFCSRYDIKILSLYSGLLEDIGSILPLKQIKKTDTI